MGPTLRDGPLRLCGHGAWGVGGGQVLTGGFVGESCPFGKSIHGFIPHKTDVWFDPCTLDQVGVQDLACSCPGVRGGL